MGGGDHPLGVDQRAAAEEEGVALGLESQQRHPGVLVHLHTTVLVNISIQ